MGKPAKGNKEVTGIGMGSKTHQIAQLMAIAAVQHAPVFHPAVDNRKNATAANDGPKMRVYLLKVIKPRKSLLYAWI
tara:strand:- start:237 stop:467 length:231 start_codon:yes stop_codon:yes gene_type:complete